MRKGIFTFYGIRFASKYHDKNLHEECQSNMGV